MKLSEVFKAIEEGKTVEFLNCKNEWEEFYPSCWVIEDAEKSKFRIKPKPLELWISFFENHNPIVHTKDFLVTTINHKCIRTAKFREVVEE